MVMRYKTETSSVMRKKILFNLSGHFQYSKLFQAQVWISFDFSYDFDLRINLLVETYSNYAQLPTKIFQFMK